MHKVPPLSSYCMLGIMLGVRVTKMNKPYAAIAQASVLNIHPESLLCARYGH